MFYSRYDVCVSLQELNAVLADNAMTEIPTGPSTRRLDSNSTLSVRRLVGTPYILCTSCIVHVRLDRTLHAPTCSSFAVLLCLPRFTCRVTSSVQAGTAFMAVGMFSKSRM